MVRSRIFVLLGLAIFSVCATRAGAEERKSANIIEVYWSETQVDLKTDRSAQVENRISIEIYDNGHYDLEALWGWRHSDFPQNRRRDISGEFGSDIPISSRSKIKIQSGNDQYTAVISNESYKLYIRIETKGRDCNADVRYVLNPGQDHFIMLSMASEQFVHFKSITTHTVKCDLGGMPSS